MAGSKLGADLWFCEYMTPWDVYQHGVTRVLAYRKTAFQEMHIVECGSYGKALVLDGKWQSSTGDEFLYHEALVHPAMIEHGAARKVLVLGGGEGATVREVLRWKDVERVVMVDIDGEVVKACREHLKEMHQGAFDDERTELVIGDALEVLDATSETWDVIISDLSDPIEEGPSFQLFTKEYFEKIRKALSPSGTFVVQAGPVSPFEVALHARICRTVGSLFPHVHSYASFVPTYGAPWGFALASASPITTLPDPDSIDALLEEKTTGGFRMLDGPALVGILQTSRNVRDAIARETRIYTLADPPKFFGRSGARE